MFFVLAYSSLWLAWFYFRKVPAFRADSFYTIMTFVMSIGSYNPFLEYPIEPSLFVISSIIMFHFAFCVSFGLFHGSSSKKPDAQTNLSRDQLLFSLLKLGSASFAFFVLIFSLLGGDIPIISSFQNVSEIRQEHWQTAYASGISDRILNLFSYVALLYLVSFPYARKRLNASIYFFIAVLVALTEHSLQSGARASIALFLIGFVAVYYSLNKISLWRSGMLIILGGFMFFVFGAYFYISRSPNFSMSPGAFLSHNCAGASYTTRADSLSVELKALVLSSCYFSSAPYFFEIFSRSMENSISYGLGAYNFSVFAGGIFVEIRQDIFDIFRHEGFGGNPWSTFARDSFIDFGWFAPVFAGVLGAFIARFSPSFAAESYLASAKFGILACFAFFMPFMSPMVIRPIVYPLLLLLVFPAAAVVYQGKIYSHNVRSGLSEKKVH
jgi:hypothetical protein